MERRTFLKVAATGGAAALTTHGVRAFAAGWPFPADRRTPPGSTIEVVANEPLAVIPPEVYGHFVEHLGGVVYDGIWVGEGSKVPNVGGIRKALVDALRAVKPAVIRWPGGCFADSYNWRDGIGPRAQRPRRANFWINDRGWPAGCPDGPWKYDANEFGTNEFVRFCRLVGGQPYLAANVRTLKAQDFAEWLDYCNAPSGTTSLADARAASGEREALHVGYWGVGNESWGCGGNFRPEDYASEYRRFVEWVPRYGEPLRFVASGPNGGDLEWTKRFFTSMAERSGLGRVWGWALHHYSWNVSGGRTTDWNAGKGQAVNYPVDEWYELLHEASRIEALITDHWAAMAESDPRHRVKLVVDEWGAWYRPGSEVDPTHLFGQQATIRDAVLAALTLNTFNRHVDKVAMANVAQLVNCLHALFLAHEDRFAVTPTYHVFDLYQAHQGNRALRVTCDAPDISHLRQAGAIALPWLSASASLRDRQVVLTVANLHAQDAKETAIVLIGGKPARARAATLTASTIQDVNTFDAPDRIRPRDTTIAVPADGRIVHVFPAASVTRMVIELS
jgi:alpha-N-arabinofuranosidase